MGDDDILELWKQAVHRAGLQRPQAFEEMRLFAQLIYDKAKEQTLISNNRQWGLMVDKEREFIARMCEDMGADDYGTLAIAAAIRNRGKR